MGAVSKWDCYADYIGVSGKARATDEYRKAMNEMAAAGLEAGPEGEEARHALQKLLGLDDLNFTYFYSLYRMKKNGKATEKVAIFEEGRPDDGSAVAFPTAIAPPDMMAHLPNISLSAVEAAVAGQPPTKAWLWVKKMFAGTGSAMDRKIYLSKILGIAVEDVHIGAKGTDIYIDLPNPLKPSEKVKVSLAEAQILQMILSAQRGEFGGVIFHDIVGTETKASMEKVWSKPSLLDATKTYSQLVNDLPSLDRFKDTFQAHLPTMDKQGNLNFNRTSPGGHALFGVDAIRAAWIPGALPNSHGKPLVSVIGNGEDLSSTPNQAMVDWMVRNKVPIVMVTTEKTGVDRQGGQIAVVRKADGTVYATIIETAQAEDANQLELFQKLGIDVKRGDQIAFFNTNMALFNYDVLAPKIKQLVKDIGEEEVMKILMPDLIDKWKKQTDFDGQVREYLQLEGAMGSTVLNLDKYWRAKYGEPLVTFINVEKERRTDFFGPIKTGFDLVMQLHSDRFSLNPKTMGLVNHRPGHSPAASFKPPPGQDKYWENVDTMQGNLKNTSLLHLDKLNVQGAVNLSETVLKGKVSVTNGTDQPLDVAAILRGRGDIPTAAGRPVLENLDITVGADGSVVVKPL